MIDDAVGGDRVQSLFQGNYLQIAVDDAVEATFNNALGRKAVRVSSAFFKVFIPQIRFPYQLEVVFSPILTP